jgi:putative membrane protein
MLKASLAKNDSKAKWLIGIFSVTVFSAVVLLGQFKLNVKLDFDVHIFAKLNAVINSVIALLLLVSLVAVKNKKYLLHKRLMLTALALSVIFLLSYITHHLLAGEAIFGDINHDGIVSIDELALAGGRRILYLALLLTHIFLAAVILPFILFTAYRALIAEFPLHKKLAYFTWPLWFYVAASGPVVYLMISPYYR